jgi:hypothetical protein
MKRLLLLLLCGGVLAACADDANDVGDSSGTISAPPAAQDTTPLWANVPETISPEWGVFFSEKGQGRETPMPAPDDVEAWKAVQAANDEAKEAAADEKAAAFGVTYEESEIAGIPVVKVTPSELASTDKIAVYTHGGAYVLNSAKAVKGRDRGGHVLRRRNRSARHCGGLHSRAPFQVAGDDQRRHQCLRGAGRVGLHGRGHRPLW